MDLPEHLETRRLRLRPPSLADAEVIFDTYAQDPEVTQYLSWSPHQHLEETAEFLGGAVADWGEPPGNRAWVVERKEDDALLGMIGGSLGMNGVFVGYVLARPYWGQGYAVEALVAVTDAFFALESVYRVWAVCDVENQASARVLAKSGFVREGILHRWLTLPAFRASGPRDCECWARIRDGQEVLRG